MLNSRLRYVRLFHTIIIPLYMMLQNSMYYLTRLRDVILENNHNISDTAILSFYTAGSSRKIMC